MMFPEKKGSIVYESWAEVQVSCEFWILLWDENAREKNVKDEKLRDGWASRMEMEIINKNV